MVNKQTDIFEKRRTEWEAKAESGEERDYSFATVSGEKVDPLYYPESPDGNYLDKLGFPGQYPYTRGIHANMYRGKLWTMRQFSGFGTPEETNKRYQFLLNQGQTGLSVAYDMPTLMGYDADDPLAAGEVGKCGVAISSLADMEVLFDGIDLGTVSVSQTINGPAIILLAFYIASAERQGIPVEELQGTLQNDILKEFIAQKEWIFPPRPHMRIITDIIEFCTDKMPKFNTISSAVITFERLVPRLLKSSLSRCLMDSVMWITQWNGGIDVDDFAPRLSFFFNSHLDFFEEVAKFRAARRIWARHMKERYKASKERSWKLRFHTQTAGCSLTAQQPEINIARTAFQALAGILGGTQSLHTNSMDETLALPTEKAAEIALRTQQVIAYEMGVANVADPLGGSWYLESLTDKLEAKAEEYFEAVAEIGGVIPAIEEGYFQREIAGAAFEYEKEVNKEERVIVGVNRFVKENGQIEIPILEIGTEAEQSQIDRLQALRETRDDAASEKALEKIERAASGDENLVQPIVNAAKAGATVGEIVSCMKRVFGEWQESPVL